MIKVCQELPAWAGPYTWEQLVSHTQSYMSHTQSGLETLKAVSHIPAADSLKKVTDRVLPDVCCDDSSFAAKQPWGCWGLVRENPKNTPYFNGPGNTSHHCYSIHHTPNTVQAITTFLECNATPIFTTKNKCKRFLYMRTGL